jgi:serine/threonine protein kinase/formylglycine-generating enzyme required for sulfatase activity
VSEATGDDREQRLARAERRLAEHLAQCAGDEPDLAALVVAHPDLEPELRELLAAHADVGRGLEVERELREGATAHAEALLAALASAPAPSERYAIEGEVGKGGMGIVFRVRDTRLDRLLAMKVIAGQAPVVPSGETPPVEPRRLARFLKEARLMGQLDHPGIAPVYELGLDAEGRAYFTMKLVRGITLAQVFERRAQEDPRWTMPAVLTVIERVCEAVAFAHERGVIHRDLKPENVMVGDFGEVYVMDWGLARRVSAEEAEAVGAALDAELAALTSLTREGAVVGTPVYMSPEQARGEIASMGPASDVYSIGAMLYQLVSGSPPYVKKGERTTASEILARIVAAPPPPLASRETPPELIAICERAMAAEPSARYASVLELGQDLHRFVSGHTVRAFETGTWAETKKWIQRNKPLAAALGAGVLVLVIGLATSSSLYVRAEDNAKRALHNEQAAKARAEDVLRLSALQDLENLIAEADALWPPHPEHIEAYANWIDEASKLVGDLPRHGRKREELRTLALPPSEEAERGEQRLPEENKQARWWEAELTKLIAGLEALQAGLLSEDAVTAEHGWSVGKRRAFAQELQAGFAPGGRYSSIWEEALPEMRTAYPGLALTPQMGLVPIGPDPASGLWEFAHLLTGEPAQRGPDGRLVLKEETGVVLVLIPGGSFWMGAQASAGRNHDPAAGNDEGPVHEVILSAYFLSKYELTQGQWKRLAGENPSFFGPDATWSVDWSAQKVEASLRCPLEQVSWDECDTVLPRFGLRLPSEAEWERGARAGTEAAWWTGPDRDGLQGAANLSDAFARGIAPPDWPKEDWLDDGYSVHAPVGSLRPNGFGIHDTLGNLWEMCKDDWASDFYARSPSVDPIASVPDATHLEGRKAARPRATEGGLPLVAHHVPFPQKQGKLQLIQSCSSSRLP